MMRLLATTAAIVGLTAGVAFAQAGAPASNAEDCLKVAFDIAQAAEGKNLPNEQLDKVEEMLTKMETHCDAKQFTEAAALATDLQSLISKQ